MVSYGYDVSNSVYSPEGKLYQLEYAKKQVDNEHGVIIGVCCTDGVVLMAEKLVDSPLYENDSLSQLFKVDKNLAMMFTGIWADGLKLANLANKEALKNKEDYGFQMDTNELCKKVAFEMYSHTLSGAVRSYGCELLVGSCSSSPQLYKVSLDGSIEKYVATAVGKGFEIALSSLETLNFTCSCEEIIPHIGKIILQVHNDTFKDRNFTFEIGIVNNSNWYFIYITILDGLKIKSEGEVEQILSQSNELLNEM
ncbi:MAG: Proteasome subunit alpha type-3 [Paramarteilia canceri]